MRKDLDLVQVVAVMPFVVVGAVEEWRKVVNHHHSQKEM
jgi:hypothetical protein